MRRHLVLTSAAVITALLAIDMTLSATLILGGRDTPSFLLSPGLLNSFRVSAYRQYQDRVFVATHKRARLSKIGPSSVLEWEEAQAEVGRALAGDRALWIETMRNGSALDLDPEAHQWSSISKANTWRGVHVSHDYVGVVGTKYFASSPTRDLFVKFKGRLDREWWSRIDALQAVASHCGLDPIGPRHFAGLIDVWPAKPGLLGDIAQAIPDSITLQRINEYIPPAQLGDLYTALADPNGINSERIVLMAIQDILFSYSDRHVGNILIDHDGLLWTIDSHEYSLGTSPRSPKQEPLVSSTFVPGTPLFIQRLRLEPDQSVTPRNMLYRLLDVRCHVSPEEPPVPLPFSVASCMDQTLLNPQVDLVQAFPGLTWKDAQVLRAQASLLHTHGVLGAHPDPDHPPCCAVEIYPHPRCLPNHNPTPLQ